jgi:hypothetical protein
MKERHDYRLKVENMTSLWYATFIVRKGKNVLYYSMNETPLALSNLVGNDAAELRFALEDALCGTVAANKVRDVLKKRNSNSGTIVTVL